MSHSSLNHLYGFVSNLAGHIKFLTELVMAGPLDRASAGTGVADPGKAKVEVTTRQTGDGPGSQSVASEIEHSELALASSGPTGARGGEAPAGGVLIINADDWGRDRENTDRTLECAARGTVSSASAMVFMEDSERAAELARESGLDAGLHLNFTAPFSAPNCSAKLRESQSQLAHYLLRHRFAQAVFNPGLARRFEYVLAAQFDEFRRIYGADPRRVDGHHHMHLCANVLLGNLLPAGCVVRRNFSFRVGERSLGNRLYRGIGDYLLTKRHETTDFFFSLAPLQPVERLQWIFSLAREHSIELETHPVNPEEYRFLTEGEILRLAPGIPIARRICASNGGV
jgi:hypothetical protein